MTEQSQRLEIPDAGGLVRTLNQRAEGRWSVSEPQGRVSEIATYHIIETDVLVDGKTIGTVKAVYHQHQGVVRVASIAYDGVMPGFTNSATKKPHFGMIAFEVPSVDRTGRDIQKIKKKYKPGPNNTPENPLYRQDGHTELDLADHEIKLPTF